MTIPADDPARKLTPVSRLRGRAQRGADRFHVRVRLKSWTRLRNRTIRTCLTSGWLETRTRSVAGKDTGGRYCLIDMHIPPGGGPPPHRHDFEEMFSILEGEIEATFRGRKTIIRTGETINIPANAPHQFQNKSEQPARLLCLCSPAGQELAKSMGSTIEGSSFSGLLTRVEIGHMRIGGYQRTQTRCVSKSALTPPCLAPEELQGYQGIFHIGASSKNKLGSRSRCFGPITRHRPHLRASL
jgi:quercetin dioxygenase-like cupin family protein